MPALPKRDPRGIIAATQRNILAERTRIMEGWLVSIPRRYIGRTMDDAYQGWGGKLSTADVAAIRRVMGTPSGFVIMRGESGVGKTTLAVTMATEKLSQGKTCSFATSIDLLQEFSFHGGDAPVYRHSRADILVIDDLGAVNEGMTAHQQRLLWALIEKRWSTGTQLTILTTNMAIQDNSQGIGLATLIGPSGWDRVSDDMELIQFRGESFRGEI